MLKENRLVPTNALVAINEPHSDRRQLGSNRRPNPYGQLRVSWIIGTDTQLEVRPVSPSSKNPIPSFNDRHVIRHGAAGGQRAETE